jgi:hypothetical protein
MGVTHNIHFCLPLSSRTELFDRKTGTFMLLDRNWPLNHISNVEFPKLCSRLPASWIHLPKETTWPERCANTPTFDPLFRIKGSEKNSLTEKLAGIAWPGSNVVSWRYVFVCVGGQGVCVYGIYPITFCGNPQEVFFWPLLLTKKTVGLHLSCFGPLLAPGHTCSCCYSQIQSRALRASPHQKGNPRNSSVSLSPGHRTLLPRQKRERKQSTWALGIEIFRNWDM